MSPISEYQPDSWVTGKVYAIRPPKMNVIKARMPKRSKTNTHDPITNAKVHLALSPGLSPPPLGG